uniref:Uncharacterized protein n=1 Tax=Arundo donax TaxID=35708 RepID=A0A0A9DI81_ARUDO
MWKNYTVIISGLAHIDAGPKCGERWPFSVQWFQ